MNKSERKRCKVLFLDSKSHYKEMVTTGSNFVFNGGIKTLVGLIDLNNVNFVVFRVHDSFLNSLTTKWLTLRNVLVVHILDGVFEWKNSYRSKHERYVLNTCSYDCVLASVNNLTYAYLTIMREVIKYQNKRILEPRLESINYANNTTILITTANKAYFDKGEFTRLIKIIKNTKNEIISLGISYKFRIFDKKIIEALEIDSADNYIHCSFNEAIVDISVVLTTASTISLEAMANCRRVGHFLYRNCPITVPAAWYFHESGDYRSTLSEITMNVPIRNDVFQQAILKEYTDDAINLDSETMKNMSIAFNNKPKFRWFERFDFAWRLIYEAVKARSFVRYVRGKIL